MSIDTARAKLNDQAKNLTDNQAMMLLIVKHLSDVLDEELAAQAELEDRTVQEMGRYIVSRARKALSGKSGGLPDETVYGFALVYLRADREEISKALTAATPAVRTEKHVEKPCAAPAAKENKKPAPPPFNRKQIDGQLSLFDLGGLDHA